MKKFKMLLILLATPILLSGCFKRDNMDGINIYTTTYPIEYLISQIYGYNSNIESIYPNGTDVSTYELTSKQIKEYSNTDMFVYNGSTKEQQIAANFLNNNHSLKIIDAAKGITPQYDVEELWLSPSNFLMMAQNIKNELNDYINATIIKQEIEEKYEALKLIISKYDADLKLIAENATTKTIIAGNDVFKFLTKYGFNVISVEENDKYLQKDYQEAKNNVTNKRNKYIYILDTDIVSENTQKIIDAGAKLVTIKSGTILTDEEVKDNYSYQELMNNFIEQLKLEVYN